MNFNDKLINLKQITSIGLNFLGIFILGIVLAGCGSISSAQSNNFTIGVVIQGPALNIAAENFQKTMGELGYVDGEQVTYLVKELNDDVALTDPAFQELIEADVDLIFVAGTRIALSAKQAVEGTDVPVVFAPVVNPVGSGLVTDLRRPGGNLTGVRADGFAAKELEWLHKIAPEASTILIPYNPTDNGPVNALKGAQAVAAELEVELMPVEVSTVEEIQALMANIPDEADAIFILPDTLVTSQVGEMIPVALEQKLPLVVHHHHRLQQGTLMSYGPDLGPMGGQAASLVVQILEGAPPGDLPIDIAEFFLGINLKTASAIELDIPDTIIQQADIVVR